jgi:hypothetical protein
MFPRRLSTADHGKAARCLTFRRSPFSPYPAGAEGDTRSRHAVDRLAQRQPGPGVGLVLAQFVEPSAASVAVQIMVLATVLNLIA